MAKKRARPRTQARPAADGGPAADAPVEPAAEALATPAATADPPAVTEPTPAVEPVPLDVPLEEQITSLPPLVYPGSENEEFDRWAAEKRRNRIRLEVIGSVVLLLAGVGVAIVSGRPAFVAMAVFGIAGLLAYEFLVTSFE